MKSSPAQSQRSLPPMPLENCSQPSDARTKDTQPDPASVLASELFDTALKDARITSFEVSQLLGVSESLVNRMRSPNYREGVSFTQMLRLPIEFHWQLNKVMSRRLGLRKRAVAELLDAVGSIALVTE